MAARVLRLALGCDGCSISRVLPLLLFIPHPADFLPHVLGKLVWPRVCSGSHLAVMALASFVPPPASASHPAGHVPRVLGVLAWTRTGLGSRLALLAAASLTGCRCVYSYHIPLALCLACWAT